MGNSIAFKTLETVKTYDGEKEIKITENHDKVLISITKQFPTPAYSMDIKKITKEDHCLKIFYDIKPPKEDMVQLQVMTYKTINIEIDKEKIGDPPYKLVLDESNTNIQKA